MSDNPKREGLIHILAMGHAICGSMPFPPSTWGPHDWWIGISDIRAIQGKKPIESLLVEGQTFCTGCHNRLPEYL